MLRKELTDDPRFLLPAIPYLDVVHHLSLSHSHSLTLSLSHSLSLSLSLSQSKGRRVDRQSPSAPPGVKPLSITWNKETQY